MSKLKKLSNDDLSDISDLILDSLDNNIFNKINSKEINDLNLDIIINYDNDELDVDLDINIDFDSLSNSDSDFLKLAIDNVYNDLDIFIEDSYKE